MTTTINSRGDALTEAVTHTIDTISRQLDLIAERAPGNSLDKVPVVRSLTAHKKRLEKALAAVEQHTSLTAQAALAAIETFEIVGENNDSREPNDDDRFLLHEFIAHAFGGYPVEQHEAAPADDARECLMDVVSHYRGLSTGLAFMLNQACGDKNADDEAYWKHEIKALDRMLAQAERALAAPLEGTGNGAVTEELNRSIEQWRKCDPDLMSRQSQAAIFYALKDAKHDILALAALVKSPKRSES
ncbi:hypothetical protein LGM46_29265 [Burkholderia arboris]|uniref:hypothetical protein n=1 Tax=Burkholderia arboris TaxID=488730 RepID=UPI001CF48606|nr:hypothetical protein [Burkholderia arboris]MCA8037062.1 hypothetical protein [Burkholderia arboris]